MASPSSSSADDSAQVVLLTFSAVAFAASASSAYCLRGGGAKAAAPEAAEPKAGAGAAAGAAAGAGAASSPRAYLLNACSLLAAVSGAGVAYGAYAVSRATSLRPYDPYAVLGLPFGSSEKEVTQAYRRMSKTAHPDRGGDPAAFHQLERAYRALTDPAAMANLRDTGNPEGTRGAPGVNVDAANSPIVFVLGLAVLLGMVFLAWRLYQTQLAAAAKEAAASEAAGTVATPTTAKELKQAKARAFQEQEAAKREREAKKQRERDSKKHGGSTSASPPADDEPREAAAKAAAESKMD